MPTNKDYVRNSKCNKETLNNKNSRNLRRLFTFIKICSFSKVIVIVMLEVKI